MTAAEMDIIIGADVDQAIAAFKKLGFEVKKIEQTAGKATGKMGKDFTGLSRVIQDLPYGFNAISNNLTQLLPAAGAAGLAFSAIVSAVTFAQIGFGAWTRGIGDNTKQINVNTSAQKESAEAIKATYQAAGQQYAQVAKLIEQSKLQVTTREQQKKILEDLKSINQEYFGSLKVEGNAITGLNAAYEAYGNNILKVARAKGAAETVEKLTKQLLETKDAVFGIDANFTSLNLTFDKAGKFLQGAEGANAFEKIASASQRVTDILAKGLPTFEEISFLAAATGLSERQINRILSDRQQLKTKEAQITAQIASNSKLIAANEIGALNGIKDKTEKILSDFFLVDTNIKDIPKKFIGAIAVETGNNMGEIQKVLDKNPLQFKFKPMEEVDKTLTKIAEATGFISSSFDKIFGSLGNGGNVFASITDGLKGLIIDLTKTLIKAAAVAVILNALGLGAFTIGSIFSQLAGLGSLLKFATGGVVTKPTLALVGEQGPERITPLGYEGTASRAIRVQVEGYISNNVIRLANRRADNAAFNTF